MAFHLRITFVAFLLFALRPVVGFAQEHMFPQAWESEKVHAPRVATAVGAEPNSVISPTNIAPSSAPEDPIAEWDRISEAVDPGSCSECNEAEVSSPLHRAAFDGVFEIMNMSPPVEVKKPLYSQFLDYVKQFQSEANEKKYRKGTSNYMTAFIKGLYEKLEPEAANQIIKILTVVAEVGGTPNDNQQIAEIAAIMKIIDNRAQVNFCQVTNRKATLLVNTRIESLADATAENALCNGQFSCWTPRNRILNQLFSYDPETTKDSMVRRVELAFLTHQKMQSGEIRFLGGLDHPEALHYHADYVRPKWAKNSLRLKSPVVAIYDRGENGMIELDKIPLSRHRGPVHYFYSGVEM